MALSKQTDTRYFELNNELNIPKNNHIQLNKDKEALHYFLKVNVKANTIYFNSLRDRLKFMFKHNYYDKRVFAQYSFNFIQKLYNALKNYHFHFASFMAAYKFYVQYAVKTNDDEYYLENYIDRVACNAFLEANGNQQLAMDDAMDIIEHKFQPATPTFLNACRKRRGEYVSCFLVQTTDTMNNIGRMINSCLQLSKIGGGVGINLTNLRAAGDPIKKIQGAASGVVPVMKLLDDSFQYSNQLGQRQGAGVVYLNVFHPDIEAFLGAKKENADESIRCKTLSLGVIIPDVWYDLCAKNKKMALFSPYDVERVYHKPFSYVNITKEYNNMIHNPKIHKKWMPARQLEDDLSKLQQESGYPYILNIDTANRDNPCSGKIVMSNLCSEILQSMKPSYVADNQHFIKVGTDVSCNLASTNIVKMMASKHMGKDIEVATHALSNIADDTNITTVPPVRKGNRLTRSIGLGGMGLASYLAKNHIYYGSKDALDFTSVYFMLLNYWSLRESNKLAKERHQTFADFKDSKYADGSYFDKYTKYYWGPRRARTKHLFKGKFIPDQHDWAKLKKSVMKYGVYNAYRMAIAPNGSTSYINDSTSSIHPIVDRIEERYESKTGKIYYPAPYLSNDTLPYYQSAYDIDMRKEINTYAVAEQHIDQSASMTMFMRSTIPKGMYEWKNGRDSDGKPLTQKMTTRDLNILRRYAWFRGIKTIYYVRTFTDDNQTIGANECTSCQI